MKSRLVSAHDAGKSQGLPKRGELASVPPFVPCVAINGFKAIVGEAVGIGDAGEEGIGLGESLGGADECFEGSVERGTKFRERGIGVRGGSRLGAGGEEGGVGSRECHRTWNEEGAEPVEGDGEVAEGPEEVVVGGRGLEGDLVHGPTLGDFHRDGVDPLGIGDGTLNVILRHLRPPVEPWIKP